jgi:thiol-disulfide isomerase/thioredoxin
MACYGCVKSYPTINKLHNQYKDNKKVEIYSVNPFDLGDKQQLKLRNYVKKYQMESNLVKMENQQFKYFQTNVYPTFYVLVDGVVKAIKIGSYDNLYDELKTLIEEGLEYIK